MNTLGAYRGLKRLTGVATFLLFGVSLVVAYLYLDNASDLWAIAMWSGIGAPVVVTLLILCLLSIGWPVPGLADAHERSRIRISTAIWVLIGIEIPWILAWLGADALGSWWKSLHATMQPVPYLWAIRLSSWLASYALASALGVVAMIVIDIRMTRHRGPSRQ